MSPSSVAWSRLAVLLAAVCGPVGPALSHQSCAPVAGQMAGYTPTARSGQELPREGVFALELQPGPDVRYLNGPGYVRGEGGFGGVLVVRNLQRGTYRLFLSAAADLELVQNYVSLPLQDCQGEDFGYTVAVDDGTVVLQLRAAAVPLLSIAFLKQ